MNLAALSPLFLEFVSPLASGFDVRSSHRFVLLVLGVIFAKGKRTVASWLRAAHVDREWRKYYQFIYTIGRRGQATSRRLALQAVETTCDGDRLLVAIDDTPTKRYGPQIEGAGRHHNPTPGPTEQAHFYGHVWVTLSLIAQHPAWGAIGLPLWACLYIRKKEVAVLPPWYKWPFQTKLEQAADLIAQAADVANTLKKKLWLAADGFYAKRPVLRAAAQHNVILVSRLRKDAALRDLPPTYAPGEKRPPGARRKYGKNRISLRTRAGHPGGWEQGTFELYGETVEKTFKTFLATWRPAGGMIRVVIVKEESTWIPFFCTDPSARVEEILSTASQRTCIEQNYHDLKEVEGTGQQQVRNVWANVGSFLLTMWSHTLVELWAWNKSHRDLCDRRGSPWDDASRRPSHGDRTKAFQREYFREEYSRLPRIWQRKRKIRSLFDELLGQAL